MKRFLRNSVAFLLAIVLIFSTVPAFAAQTQPQPQPQTQPQEQPQVKMSPWAAKPLTDAQMMGLLTFGPENMNKDFTKEVTQEDLTTLDKKFTEKLKSKGLKENPNFKAQEVGKDSTRKTVILHIFNLVGKYDPKVNAETDPIKYLAENNILKGKGNDYGLEDVTTLEEAVTLYARAITDIYDDNDLGGKGVFYKVENKGNTAYLFGSIHLGEADLYPIEAERMKAFEESDELYVEINILNPEVLAEVQKLQTRTDGKTLEADLGPELYKRLKTAMEKFGIKEEAYKNIELWALFGMLEMLPMQTENPYAAMMGIETYFITLANLQGKPIYDLEDAKLQMGTLKEYYSQHEEEFKQKAEEVVAFLEKGDFTESIKGMKTLLKIWKEGNVEELAEIFEGDETSKILLVKRDPAMAEKIKGLLESEDGKTYFILVGAGHYAPENSVLKYLEDYGFKVEELNK